METFDLDIKDRIFIDLHTLCLHKIFLQLCLRFFLDGLQIRQYVLIVLVSKKLLQIGGVLHKFRSNQSGQIIG